MPRDEVDLRSDTVTRPSPAMRAAMASAEVGDDGFGDDPTTRALEEHFAALVGKEAALFVPSGTMANQVALRVLGPPGTAVIAGRTSHVAGFELGAFGANGWAQLVTLDDASGRLDPAEVAWHVAAARDHWVPVSVVAVENTHMFSGGTPLTPDQIAAIGAVAPAVHLDGARLFNAVVATGCAASEFAAHTTTVTCCLSKGLGAPVGSVLAGDEAFVAAARGERKRLGGAMRQVGILAAAGLVALEGVERLADDHERARTLARAVAERWPGCGLDPTDVATNVVIFPHPDPPGLLAHLASHGVLATTTGPGLVRLVTHLDVDDVGVARACEAIASAP